MKGLSIKRICIPLIGTVIGCVSNFVSQNQTFAVTDDYRLITATQNLRPLVLEGHARLEASTGRVIPGLLFKLIWFGVDDIHDLWYVRLIGVSLVGLSVGAFLVWFAVKAEIVSSNSLFLLALLGLLTLLLPGVAATTTWATKTAHLLALPFAMAGGLVATKSTMSRVRWGVVVLLVFGSVFSYQHFALLAAFPVALVVALPAVKDGLPRYFWRPLVIMGIGFIAILANIAVVRLMEQGVLDRISDRPFTNRFKELFDVLAKGALLYVERSVPLVLTSVVVALCVLYAAIRRSGESWKLLLGTGVAVAGSVLLTFGADGESSYRMVLPTQLIIWLGLGSVAAYVLNSPSSRSVTETLLVLPAFIVAVMVALTSTTGVIKKDIALRNADDWKNTVCEMNKMVDGEIPSSIAVQLRPVEIVGPDAVRSEIGLTASNIGWLFVDQWNLALSSEINNKSLARVPIEIVDEEFAVHDRDSYRIDLRIPCTTAVN